SFTAPQVCCCTPTGRHSSEQPVVTVQPPMLPLVSPFDTAVPSAAAIMIAVGPVFAPGAGWIDQAKPARTQNDCCPIGRTTRHVLKAVAPPLPQKPGVSLIG